MALWTSRCRLNSRYLSPEARAFERELASPDPVRLFLEVLPTLLGKTPRQYKTILRGVSRIKDELVSIQGVFEAEAVKALGQILFSRGFQSNSGVRQQAGRWARHFPQSFARRLPDRVSQGVLARLRADYPDDAALANALSVLLIGRPIRQWDDTHIPAFRRQLRNTFEVIESAALALRRTPSLDPALRAGLTALAEAKTLSAADELADIVGADQAAGQLETIAKALRKRGRSSVTAKEPDALSS